MVDADTQIGITTTESSADTDQKYIDTKTQILTACLQEYPNVQLEVVDYEQAYENGGKNASFPYPKDFQGSEYPYFVIPLDRKGYGATLGMPTFAQGFMERIQDSEQPSIFYIIYPYKNCEKIDILKFPTDIINHFLTNDPLRNRIAWGANADSTPDLKQRFEVIRKITAKFNKKS